MPKKLHEYKCRECDKTFTLKHEPKRLSYHFACPSCRRKITRARRAPIDPKVAKLQHEINERADTRTPEEKERDRQALEESRDVLNRFFFGARGVMKKKLGK